MSKPIARRQRMRARRRASRDAARRVGEQRIDAGGERVGVLAATTRAVSPSRAISGMAPAAVVTQGTPANIACSSACGTPSFAYDGSTNTSSAREPRRDVVLLSGERHARAQSRARRSALRARRAADRRRRSTRRASRCRSRASASIRIAMALPAAQRRDDADQRRRLAAGRARARAAAAIARRKRVGVDAGRDRIDPRRIDAVVADQLLRAAPRRW